MSAARAFTVGGAHPALAGHFPGAPIVPGVLLLDEIVHALAPAQGTDRGRWRIGSAKFLRPVRPGEPLTLETERLTNGSVRFRVCRDGEPVAHGMLHPIAGGAREPDVPSLP